MNSTTMIDNEFSGHLYVKSDVYSFGVVLLELLTGLRVLDMHRPNGAHNLIEWARPFLPDKRKLNKIMDPRLENHFSSKATFQAAKLILQCLEYDPKNRPSMEEVLETLQQVNAIKMKPKGSKAGRDLLQQGLHWQIQSGRNVKFWEDCWIPSIHGFKITSPRPVDCSVKYVADVIDPSLKSWKLGSLVDNISVDEVEAIQAIPIAAVERDDSLVPAAFLGHAKINCDATYYHGSLLASIVAVFRDSSSKLIDGNVRMMAASSASQVEAFAVYMTCPWSMHAILGL
ncbi:hypothetical protein ACSBR1_029275 [Camellia fascicularis]